VLFARGDSVYKALPDCDVFDQERDARTFDGNCPIVAHPPCRGWGRLRGLANPTQDELANGVWAADQVRKNGGVLEHPAGSLLWYAAFLPHPGSVDRWGGWTLPVAQQWWGHRAEKLTWLYIRGVEPAGVPVMPLVLGRAERVIGSSSIRKGHPGFRSECTRAEREATPIELALWLVELAQRSKRH
jgi:hypothetical protein